MWGDTISIMEECHRYCKGVPSALYYVEGYHLCCRGCSGLWRNTMSIAKGFISSMVCGGIPSVLTLGYQHIKRDIFTQYLTIFLQKRDSCGSPISPLRLRPKYLATWLWVLSWHVLYVLIYALLILNYVNHVCKTESSKFKCLPRFSCTDNGMADSNSIDDWTNRIWKQGWDGQTVWFVNR